MTSTRIAVVLALMWGPAFAGPAYAQQLQLEADGTTPLHRAVQQNERALVTQLLASGADATARTRYGVTPIELASAGAAPEIVEALLGAGADANTVTREGETVLMAAARAGNVGAVRALLARGADANAVEQWQGQTALMWAAAANHADVVRALLEAGATPDVAAKSFPGQPRLPRGQGVAIQAAHSNFPKGGLSALHFAAREGAIDAARALLDGGASPDVADPDSLTPLHLAIINAHFDLAALLVDRGADVNKGDRAGRTPLFMTADANSMEWLFSRPIPEPSGELDALDLAPRLLDKGANVDGALTGRPFILHHNATGNRNIAEGATAFFKAATTSDLPMMRLLLEREANPLATTRNGTTALMALAGLNWVEISSLGTEEESLEGIKLLLERGADVNAVNSLGETAMHGAAQRGADRIVQFLADNGAQLDVVNKDGRTPFDEARGQADTSAEDNVRRPEHKSTQALLQRLIAARAAR
ncbi:MAG: ankyrin repeat domain-containing protein [Vicinamibacterales bacterium]